MKVYILTTKQRYTINELQIIAVYENAKAAEKAALELGYEKLNQSHQYYRKDDWIAEVEEWEVDHE